MVDDEEFEEQGGAAAICRCGLSNNKPYCDGSHAATTDEEDGVVYEYENDDDESPRHVTEEQSRTRSKPVLPAAVAG